MERRSCDAKRLVGKWRDATTVAAILAVLAFTSGCTANRIAYSDYEADRPATKVSEVKFFDSLRKVSQPWTVVGMISAYTQPSVADTAEKRVNLVRSTAADLGISYVVGLQSLTRSHRSDNYWVSIALLANAGSERALNTPPRPKFIAVVLPINSRLEANPLVEKLSTALLDGIQYVLPHNKGYYIFHDATAGVSAGDVLRGNVNPVVFSDRLGVAPDYAFLIELSAIEKQYHDSCPVSGTLVVKTTLYDLEEKRIAWTNSTEGCIGAVKEMTPEDLAIWIGPTNYWYWLVHNGYLTEEDAKKSNVRIVFPIVQQLMGEKRDLILVNAVEGVLKSMPMPKGFHPGKKWNHW